MSDLLVKVEGVSKKFCRDLKKSLWYGVRDIAGELMGSTGERSLRPEEFWAVDNVSFELRAGECLGLIGFNGAGKSTLLKMLNGLIKPDRGRIEMHGRIGALIELGAGFNPILTGRENVYNNGAVLGFSKKEIDSRFDRIVEFSEIGDFIDTPVQNYSSGMKVRLGFAVASQMEPDVLLVDEVLAVGDLGFRIKCYNEIYRIMERATVILVSHSLTQIAKVCNRGLLLQQGAVGISSCNLEDVFNEYYKDVKAVKATTVSGNGKAELQDTWVYGGDISNGVHFRHHDPDQDPGKQPVVLQHGKPACFRFKVKLEDVESFEMGLTFTDMESKIVAQCLSSNSGKSFANGAPSVTVDVALPFLELAMGKYSLSIGVYSSDGRDIAGTVLLSIKDFLEIQVVSDSKLYGAAPVQLSGSWKTVEANPE